MDRVGIQKLGAKAFLGSSLICFFICIVDSVRILMLPHYSFDWALDSTANMNTFLAIDDMRHGLAADILVTSVLGLAFAIPVSMIYFDTQFQTKRDTRTGQGRFRKLVCRLPAGVFKALALECILLLEVSFLLTSHVLWVDNLQNFVFYQLLPIISARMYILQSFAVWDYYCLGFLLVAVFLAFITFAKSNNLRKAILKTIQLAALVLLPLGLEIFFFDRSEFYLHVMTAQTFWGLTWFTNADLLYSSLVVFVITTTVLILATRETSTSEIMTRSRQVSC